MNTHDDRDPVVVIGGGPGGSTAAALLAQHGRRVVVLEKASFPRFHIGESLVPASQRVWARLGLTEALAHGPYKLKLAGELRLARRGAATDVHVSRIIFTKVPRSLRPWSPSAFQVERAVFDQQLLEHARASGVEVHEQARVVDVVFEPKPRVIWSDASGTARETPASFVIDASGRLAFLSRKLGLFRNEEHHSTSSAFAHFRGIEWPGGEAGGYIETYFIEGGWVWAIPLHDGRTSVGLVMENRLARSWPRLPEETLRRVIENDAYLKERFRGAELASRVRILRNLPYTSSRFTGSSWALVGDAGFFVDPLNSTGVHVAMQTGMEAADAVHAHLNGSTDALAAYEREMRRHYTYVRRTISLLYEILRYRVLIALLVRGTGEVSNNWSGPWLNRVGAWAMGMYTSFIPAMWLIWMLFWVLLPICRVYYVLTGRDPWPGHPRFFDTRPGQGEAASPTAPRDAA